MNTKPRQILLTNLINRVLHNIYGIADVAQKDKWVEERIFIIKPFIRERQKMMIIQNIHTTISLLKLFSWEFTLIITS